MLQKLAQGPQGNKGCETADQTTVNLQADYRQENILSTGLLQQNQRCMCTV